MKKHPALLMADALAEVNGIDSPAFMKMFKAAAAFEDMANEWTRAFEAEHLAHHVDSNDMVSAPCAKIPRYDFDDPVTQ